MFHICSIYIIYMFHIYIYIWSYYILILIVCVCLCVYGPIFNIYTNLISLLAIGEIRRD